VALAWSGLLGCSGTDNGRRLRVGNEPPGEADGGGGFAGSGPGPQADGGIASSANELSVRITDGEAMTLTIVTLGCAGACADVEAVATGGNPPYQFVWDDGATTARRHVCLDATMQLSVTATDTALATDEFQHEAQTAIAKLNAQVLECNDAGTPPPNDCGAGATLPFLLVPSHPSAFTTTYTQANGNHPDYAAGAYGAPPGPLAIVDQAQSEIHLGTCSQLLLAASADGTKDVGWDDTLVVEYRAAPGGPVDKRWFYGTVSPVTYTPASQMLTSVVTPSVPGSSLDPPVPNPQPFGFPALAIDLMSEAPSADRDFELTVHVLDTGGFGSTTEIWLIPR